METYDQITAEHYAAFRPPLHEVILKKCLKGPVDYGLDIGCGTGSSTIPLTMFCDQVVGIDPSREMLSKSTFHPQVAYSLFNGQDLEFNDQIFDLVTFAGSLFYAKSQRLLDETIRVCKPGATILVYDFEVLVHPIFSTLGLSRSSQTTSYQHDETFEGLDQAGIERLHTSRETISLPIQPKDMAHLLLSDSHDYLTFSEQLGREDLFQKLTTLLLTLEPLEKIDADVYYSMYQRSPFIG